MLGRSAVRAVSTRESALRPRVVTYLGGRRTIAASVPLASDGSRPQGVRPESHEREPVSTGGHVSDHAKQDEGRMSGVPASEEDSQGIYDVAVAVWLTSAAPLARVPLPELFSLKNRAYIVTGGARGLGLTVARALLEAGAHVHCLDLLSEPDKAGWAAAESLADSSGLRITYHQVDVTSQSSLSSTFSKCFESQPPSVPVRGLYVAAGINQIKPALEYTPDEFKKVIDVNLTGTFFVAQAFAKEWFARNPHGTGKAGQGASVVLTGSMSAHIANVGLLCAAYNASKAGVNQLAKNLAAEWSGRGIRVNSVSPGYVRTALTAALLDAQPELDEIWHRKKLLNRLATPDEMRGPIAYLLSDASSFMTGADLLVDGGHCAT